MLAKLRAHLSYANVISTLCLFILLGGSAYAVTRLDRNSVKSRHIVNGQVKAQDIAADAVRSEEIAADAVRSEEIAAGSVAGSEIAADAVSSASVANGSLAPADIAGSATTAVWQNVDVAANACVELTVPALNLDPEAAVLVLPRRRDGVDPGWDPRLILDGYGPRGTAAEETLMGGPVLPFRICNLSDVAVEDARLSFLILGFG